MPKQSLFIFHRQSGPESDTVRAHLHKPAETRSRHERTQTDKKEPEETIPFPGLFKRRRPDLNR